LELSDIDIYGNQFVTVNIPFVNDQDKFQLNVRRMYYDTGLSKIKFADLGFDRLAYNTSGLVVSPSGTQCVFVSDADGGFGRSDLWAGNMVYNDQGEPMVENFYNLGENINTIKSEFDPCYVSEDILVFASDGHTNLGGRDLYAFHLTSGKLMHLGDPINSRFDEVSPKFIDGYLYFSSNRIENRFDIFRMPLNVKALEATLAPDIHGEYVSEPSGNEFPADVNVNSSGRIESLREIRNRLKENDPRKYNFTRGVDFLLAEDSVRELLIEAIDEQSDPADFKFMTLNHPSGHIVIEEDFERELLLLVKILKKRPDWAVVIRSHTDSKGSSNSNKKLSEERAAFLGDYLKFLKVSVKQIILEGLGESFPVNHCFDGAPCTEEELSKNRRTDLVLIRLSS
jgi:outer membrane protein OmpA-like peptidoglycan-associated protein